MRFWVFVQWTYRPLPFSGTVDTCRIRGEVVGLDQLVLGS